MPAYLKSFHLQIKISMCLLSETLYVCFESKTSVGARQLKSLHDFFSTALPNCMTLSFRFTSEECAKICIVLISSSSFVSLPSAAPFVGAEEKRKPKRVSRSLENNLLPQSERAVRAFHGFYENVVYEPLASETF